MCDAIKKDMDKYESIEVRKARVEVAELFGICEKLHYESYLMDKHYNQKLKEYRKMIGLDKEESK